MVSPAKHSGIGSNQQTGAFYKAWGTNRNWPTEIGTVYTSRNSWSALTNKTWTITNFDSIPEMILDVHQPFWPEKSGGSLAEAAKGSYNKYWKDWAKTVRDLSNRNIETTFAWEWNGNWYEWQAKSYQLIVEAFKQVAGTVLMELPEHRINWVINGKKYQHFPVGGTDPLKGFPGKDFVTGSIGIDFYDHYSPARTEAEFDSQVKQVGGLTWLWDFAQSEGLDFSIPEWGVVSGRGSNGGMDNPLYIRKMWEWMRDHTTYSECYFSTDESNNVKSAFNINPKASTEYYKLWGKNFPRDVPEEPEEPEDFFVTEDEKDLILRMRHVYGQS